MPVLDAFRLAGHLPNWKRIGLFCAQNTFRILSRQKYQACRSATLTHNLLLETKTHTMMRTGTTLNPCHVNLSILSFGIFGMQGGNEQQKGDFEAPRFKPDITSSSQTVCNKILALEGLPFSFFNCADCR